MAGIGWEIGIELAAEKGPAPIVMDEFTVTEHAWPRPEMCRDGYKVGDKVPGGCCWPSAATCSSSTPT